MGLLGRVAATLAPFPFLLLLFLLPVLLRGRPLPPDFGRRGDFFLRRFTPAPRLVGLLERRSEVGLLLGRRVVLRGDETETRRRPPLT